MAQRKIRNNSKNKLEAAAIIAVATTAMQVYGKAKDYWNANYTYTLTVEESDRLYDAAHKWLVQATPDDKHRALNVSTGKTAPERTLPPEFYEDDEETSNGLAPKPAPLVKRFNASTTRKVRIEGHRVTVRLRRPDITEGTAGRDKPSSWIEFHTTSHEAQQAVVRLLEKLNAAQTKTRKATLKMVNQWGNWTSRSDLPPRTMASVSLAPEQKGRIQQDLETFLTSEEQYNRLAIPWHRGYMLYGPPGTGKTSLVKALANHYNLDLWYISLADLKAESSLLDLIGSVGPRSILLLEDIDTMKITHDRDSTDQGQISTSSLLNALDGVATPHGLITVMTTNRFEILDPALTRAGRMDLIEELGYPTRRTIANMYEHFYSAKLSWPKNANWDEPLEGVSTSSISELFKRHMSDSTGARKAVLDFVNATAVG